MTTETPPNKKSRRIIDDEDDDSDDLPDIDDPGFLNGPKATTPQPVKDDEDGSEGLFSADEEASEKEEGRGSQSRKRCLGI